MNGVQVRFQKDVKLLKPYSYGPYNKFNSKEQWIRITEGCPHNHAYCYEPTEIKIFGIPEIVRNTVRIMDMNLLCKPQALQIIRDLGEKRVNGKVVVYDLLCGIDRRFLTQKMANALYGSRFRKIRFAWDGSFSEQREIKKTIKILRKAGYRSTTSLMVFILCNYRIKIEECLDKLDICKVWRVQVADCYFDGQKKRRRDPIIPVFWSGSEIKKFRHKVRTHNIMVNFGVDVER
jgi:hypothetical protein